MSVILDALRKLDHEKSSRQNRTANIAIEILRPDLDRPGRKIQTYFAAVFLTAVASAAITYVLIAQFGFLSKSSYPAYEKPSASSQQVTPVPLPPGPIRDTKDQIGRIPLKIQKPAKSKRSAEVRSPVESKSPVIPLDEKKPSRDVIPGEANVILESGNKSAEQIQGGPAIKTPSFILSGIVWSEEPSKRMAVINGTITTEGSVIAGVKIVEIHSDHVILLRDDQPFELSLFK